MTLAENEHGLLLGPPLKIKHGTRWTKPTIRAAIRWFYEKHGRLPTALEWKRAGPHPSYGAVRRHFHSWANAIEAAGFPRPPVGVYVRASRYGPRGPYNVGPGAVRRLRRELAEIEAAEIASLLPPSLPSSWRDI